MLLQENRVSFIILYIFKKHSSSIYSQTICNTEMKTVNTLENKEAHQPL